MNGGNGLLSELGQFGQVRTVQKPDGHYVEVIITPESLKRIITANADPKMASATDVRVENGVFVVSVKLI